MAELDGGWEEIPSYFELLSCVRNFIVTTVAEFNSESSPTSWNGKSWSYCNFTKNDAFLMILFATALTILRCALTEWLFKPVAHHYALTPASQKKMPESAWKFLYYLCAWSYAFYVVILSGTYNFFQKPSTVWNDWSLDEPIPMDIYLMYMMQCGFYVHSLYATVFLDTWRKDSVVMLVHHVLTLVLISVSYSLRYHNIGALVLLLHDVCDIELEFTKLNVYFKTQGGKLIYRHEVFANVSFFCFALSWFVSRLYWYPLKVLYTATCDVAKMQLNLPCASLMNSLLWILQALNIYWFLFVLGFLYRVAMGQVNEFDDTRDYDVEEKFSKKISGVKEENGSICNGDMKSNGVFQEMSNGKNHISRGSQNDKKIV